jgi:L-cystine uptake protein TcyP (sodium:dicarboxylate symporter family)
MKKFVYAIVIAAALSQVATASTARQDKQNETPIGKLIATLEQMFSGWDP